MPSTSLEFVTGSCGLAITLHNLVAKVYTGAESAFLRSSGAGFEKIDDRPRERATNHREAAHNCEHGYGSEEIICKGRIDEKHELAESTREEGEGDLK